MSPNLPLGLGGQNVNAVGIHSKLYSCDRIRLPSLLSQFYQTTNPLLSRRVTTKKKLHSHFFVV
ncbi:hypothetical protein NDI37_17305 [Funiculus sociatus GB2-A5]|uniref:Uncharacterized protein n=1 Tax=Funiculus sociatus GB2-A5 TaxID=2933946 RepID=A0ABV0JS53_9CYAN|nr:MULTISPECIES: hypothetical protein [unclassified Trichocoleus]MBD1908508.1 hypothetical protein [Trichocoleus sp. FACHB-832]MBD2065257.1 hypothetical protein [Trichocoleus sp. FACHB-6]